MAAIGGLQIPLCTDSKGTDSQAENPRMSSKYPNSPITWSLRANLQEFLNQQLELWREIPNEHRYPFVPLIFSKKTPLFWLTTPIL